MAFNVRASFLDDSCSSRNKGRSPQTRNRELRTSSEALAVTEKPYGIPRIECCHIPERIAHVSRSTVGPRFDMSVRNERWPDQKRLRQPLKRSEFSAPNRGLCQFRGTKVTDAFPERRDAYLPENQLQPRSVCTRRRPEKRYCTSCRLVP